jgi:hypothetical protein
MLKQFAAAGVMTVLVAHSLPAIAQTAKVGATTPVVDEETITGARTGYLPTPPVISAFFTLPIETKVVKDAAITTNTPVTDKTTSLAAWGEAIRECLKQKPALVRNAKGTDVPFLVGDMQQGTIKLNANDRPVCPS